MLNILIAGHRGQNIPEITRILITAFNEQGYHARGIVNGENDANDNFVHSFIRISKAPIKARNATQKADYLLAFDHMLVSESRVTDFMKKETASIINTAETTLEGVETRSVLLVNAREYVGMNTALLGFAVLGAFVGATTHLPLKQVLNSIDALYEPKGVNVQRIIEQTYERVRKQVILS